MVARPHQIKVKVQFDKIDVNSITNASGVFNGNTSAFGWSTHSKTNNGFGTVSGHHNNVIKNVAVVDDKDLVDTPIDDRDTMWSQGVPSEV